MNVLELAQNWITIIAILAIWDAAWKLIALWKAARDNAIAWFICIGIFNTAGILPIIYLLISSKNIKRTAQSFGTKTALLFITLSILGAFSLKAQEITEKEKQSYAVGVILGEKIKEKIAESGIDLGIFDSLKETIKEKIDFQSLKNGLKDIMKDECKISKEEIGSVLEEILKKAGEIEKFINEKKEANKNEEIENASQCPINYQLTISRYYAGLSWYYLFTKEYAQSEQSARKALELDGTYLLPKTNLAHALLFQNRFSKAETIYKELSQTIYQDNETYTKVLLKDLDELEKAGVIPEKRKADVAKIKQMLQQ